MKKKWKIDEIKPGDMIRVYNGVYYHYAIYLGNNQIIQFGKVTPIDDSTNIKVEIVSTDDFKQYQPIEVRQYTLIEKMKKRKAKKIIEISKSRLREQGYNFNTNNCLDFVNQCVFKK